MLPAPFELPTSFSIPVDAIRCSSIFTLTVLHATPNVGSPTRQKSLSLLQDFPVVGPHEKRPVCQLHVLPESTGAASGPASREPPASSGVSGEASAVPLVLPPLVPDEPVPDSSLEHAQRDTRTDRRIEMVRCEEA